MEHLRIVFMGTPDFAVGILDTILKNKFEVVGVITAPDKPAGRGQKISYSAIKEYALQNNLPLLQPTNLKEENFLVELKKLQANVQVVVAFRMLPEVVWKLPKLGTFNLHASLLPQYRGAAPINWAIINGELKTGVTSFFIDDKIDTGSMILSKEIEIYPDENAGSLHYRLMVLGSEVVVDTLNLIKNGNVKTTIQSENEITKTAHKLNKENCKIDYNKKGKEIINLIRGLSPYPAAWCYLNIDTEDWNIKIYDAKFEPTKHSFKIGQIIKTKKELKVAVLDGFIEIITIQLPGKKRMQVKDLLNGLNLNENAFVF